MHILLSYLVALILFITPVTKAHNVIIPPSLDEMSLSKISDDIYVIHGMLALPDKNNLGFISNTGIVLSDQGVVIIDTGGSFQVGELILKKIKELTDKPVIAVFNTHIHGDHWLGNAAVRNVYPNASIYAHKRAIERLQMGAAEQWRDVFMDMTDNAVRSRELVLPDKSLNGGEILKIAGKEYKTHHTGHAHTDNDIMIEYAEGKTLFAGDIIEHRRAVSSDVPQDFNAKGQIDAIRYALELPVNIFVPGHGQSGGKEIPQSSLRFLQILYNSVKRYYEQDMEDFEMRDRVIKDLDEFKNWSGFDQIGKLISYVYQQVEAAEFE